MVGAVEAFVLFFFFFLISQEEKGCGRGARWLETLSLSVSLSAASSAVSCATSIHCASLSITLSPCLSLFSSSLLVFVLAGNKPGGAEKKKTKKKKQDLAEKQILSKSKKKVPARTCRAELLWDRTIFTPRLAFTS